jgi:Holliday junction resolvase
MRESVLVTRILEELRSFGAKVIKVHGSQYIEAGTPDLMGCYHGRPFAIECKINKNHTTRLQLKRLDEWRSAGAVAVVAREDFDTAAFLRMVCPRRWECD